MLETRGLYRTDGKCPGGVAMIPWEMGKQLVWDVTIGIPDVSATDVWTTIWRRTFRRQHCRRNVLYKAKKQDTSSLIPLLVYALFPESILPNPTLPKKKSAKIPMLSSKWDSAKRAYTLKVSMKRYLSF